MAKDYKNIYRKNLPKTLKEYILTRVLKHNQNFMGCFIGETGSGKSYAALSVAKMLDPNFTIENVCFTSKAFMELINDPKLKKGAVIIYDEAGVGMAARDWYRIQNKILSYCLQTFRFKNYIVFFTVPDFSYIDVAARKLFKCVFKTHTILRNQKLCVIKPLFVNVDYRSGKHYFKYPRLAGKKLSRIRVALPDRAFRRKYEGIKKEYTKALYKDALEQLGDTQSLDAMTDRERSIFEARKTLCLSVKDISEKLKVTPQAIYKTIKTLGRKGYIV